MNLCMDPCLVAELIHVLFPMHICYTKPNPLCLFWDSVSVQPGRCCFCVGVWSVVLAPACSQCFWGGFFLLQLLQGFCWCPEFSSFFPSWPLEESAFMDLLHCQECSKPQRQPGTHGFRIRNEQRQENIYVEFFFLILWSWLNWSKRVAVPSWNHWWDSNYRWAVFCYWNGAQNDEITCWVIRGNVHIPGTLGIFCLSHEQYLSWQWTWEETEEIRTSIPRNWVSQMSVWRSPKESLGEASAKAGLVSKSVTKFIGKVHSVTY